ncbi:MAG: leucine--tRNA ligase, partial [Acidobacteriota bacterium]
VLHPMGWDAYGLPTERAALRENIHPAKITKRNIDNFRRQIKRLGFSYDWEREISTASPDYYKWTQWIFLKLHEKGLAYMAEVPVNWCPALGTVLANEEVKDGKYIETGDPVEPRLMKQWMLKITAYAERLLQDLELVDWPEGVKEMQRNWIGKSTGADVLFGVAGTNLAFQVFTTRPDTLFGATYCVIAPEHHLIPHIVSEEQREAVEGYIEESKQKTDQVRTDLTRQKTGVPLGADAVNPATGKRVPIWTADYVLISYGTGAIMAVPGHDQRDHEFACHYGLPIVEVVSGGEKPIPEAAHSGDGTLVNSGFLNGLEVDPAKQRMIEWLESEKQGRRKVQYRLRDWLFSRQRYWGEPFPMLHLEDGTTIPLPEDELPLELPPVDEYRPTPDGRPPLARAGQDWLEVTLPDGRKARRETNTMPQWAGSCWYYLRYLDPRNDREGWSQQAENYWMPVDLYIGGVEHAVLHLLYARFWHKVLYDCGCVHTKEPFQKLFNQGMILAYSYRDEQGKYRHPHEVEEKDGRHRLKETGEKIKAQIEKMSKSKLNVANPDEVIDEYGADSMRLYELFMGPLELTKPWQTEGVEGVHRFLHRVWRLVVKEQDSSLSQRISQGPGPSQAGLWKTLHQTIKKVRVDTLNLRFNTAIAQMMIFVNEATVAKSLPRETLQTFLTLLSPYAPHIAEELWSRMGLQGLVCQQDWPEHDEGLIREKTVAIALQVNGKRRDEMEVPADTDKNRLEELALASEKVQKYLQGKTPRRVIVVPGRLVNVVV